MTQNNTNYIGTLVKFDNPYKSLDPKEAPIGMVIGARPPVQGTPRSLSIAYIWLVEWFNSYSGPSTGWYSTAEIRAYIKELEEYKKEIL